MKRDTAHYHHINLPDTGAAQPECLTVVRSCVEETAEILHVNLHRNYECVFNQLLAKTVACLRLLADDEFQAVIPARLRKRVAVHPDE